jgi:ATP-dependent Zn protease
MRVCLSPKNETVNDKNVLFSTGNIKTFFNDVKGCEEVKEEIDKLF